MKRISHRRVLAALSALALSAGLIVGTATPASADEFPSWQDVQNAKANESAAQAQVTRIEGLITQLEGEVAAAQAEAERRGQEFYDATQRFDLADQRATQLQAQADEGKAKADAATLQAGKLAAQLYRTGSGGLTTNMLLNSGKDGADRLLSDLSSMSKLLERNSGIYDQALVATNTATSLADQAAVAKTEREKLRVAAEQALEAAIQASQAAQDQLAAQQEQIGTLKAQLAALKDTTAKTVAGFEEGERARKAAEEEARRKAAEAAAGAVGPQGWASPIRGWISSSYGPRSCAGCADFHNGTDIAAPEYSIIHSAAAGTVRYTGWVGNYGKVVIVSHAGGVETWYAHTGSYLVSQGQQVSAGQGIARVGMTGFTNGPHLHFEVRNSGGYGSYNPVSFLAARGITLGY